MSGARLQTRSEPLGERPFPHGVTVIPWPGSAHSRSLGERLGLLVSQRDLCASDCAGELISGDPLHRRDSLRTQPSAGFLMIGVDVDRRLRHADLSRPHPDWFPRLVALRLESRFDVETKGDDGSELVRVLEPGGEPVQPEVLCVVDSPLREFVVLGQDLGILRTLAVSYEREVGVSQKVKRLCSIIRGDRLDVELI